MTAKTSAPVASAVQLFMQDGTNTLIPLTAVHFPAAPAVVKTVDFTYELVPASAADQVLGAAGAAGDFLHRIVIDTNSGAITVKDGATTVFVIPSSASGTYEINAVAVTNWNISTALTTTCMCVGRFT